MVTDLAELRAQWYALATDSLAGLPREAIEASVRHLARELLARTGGEQVTRFVCPRCRMASAHPRDIVEGYCGACHDWTARING